MQVGRRPLRSRGSARSPCAGASTHRGHHRTRGSAGCRVVLVKHRCPPWIRPLFCSHVTLLWPSSVHASRADRPRLRERFRPFIETCPCLARRARDRLAFLGDRFERRPSFDLRCRLGAREVAASDLGRKVDPLDHRARRKCEPNLPTSLRVVPPQRARLFRHLGLIRRRITAPPTSRSVTALLEGHRLLSRRGAGNEDSSPRRARVAATQMASRSVSQRRLVSACTSAGERGAVVAARGAISAPPTSRRVSQPVASAGDGTRSCSAMARRAVDASRAGSSSSCGRCCPRLRRTLSCTHGPHEVRLKAG